MAHHQGHSLVSHSGSPPVQNPAPNPVESKDSETDVDQARGGYYDYSDAEITPDSTPSQRTQLAFTKVCFWEYHTSCDTLGSHDPECDPALVGDHATRDQIIEMLTAAAAEENRAPDADTNVLNLFERQPHLVS